jgi:hypothetical protein
VVYRPETERQLRPLAHLPTEERREAWAEACRAAGGDRPPTGKEVEAAARQVEGLPPPPPPPSRVAIDGDHPMTTARDIVNALGGDCYRINILIQAIADLSHDPLHTWACLKRPRRLRRREAGESV